MAVLRASTTGVAGPSDLPSRLRPLALLGALVAAATAFFPPVWSAAHSYEVAETVQFGLFAFAVPALVVVGRPWGRLGGTADFGRFWHRLEALESGRRRHPYLWRSLAFAGADVGLVVLWRIPSLMDALARHRWLVGPEAVSLIVAGIGLWLELVPCAPLSPRLARPWRAVLAAVTMWAVWILAYAVGFAHVPWYRAFHHVGGLLGASMDQEIATGVMWFGAASAFIPVIFSDLVNWLKADEDPDAELRGLVRSARRSGRA